MRSGKSGARSAVQNHKTRRKTSAGVWNGINVSDSLHNALMGNQTNDDQVSHTQGWGIGCDDTSDYNTFIGNKAQGNINANIALVGSNNTALGNDS